MSENEQNLIQKKISLANSEYSPIIIELMKDCMTKTDIIGKDQWSTIVNAITLEVQSNMIIAMSNYLEEIKKGKLLELK